MSYKIFKTYSSKLHKSLNNNYCLLLKKIEPKMNSMTIGTHDGIFHCDEVLACAMLKHLPDYANSTVIRTRDESILEQCDLVVDVGGIYNHDKKRYDHHQKSFTNSLSSICPNMGNNFKIRLSSAGLIYAHYGEKIIKEVLNKQFKDKSEEITDDCIKIIFKMVYKHFIEEIDGIDNGVPMFDSEPLYKITTDLSSRVASLNLNGFDNESVDVLVKFNSALSLVDSEFKYKIYYYMHHWWPARKIVIDAINNRFDIHESGEILQLSEFCHWKDHLSLLEKEYNIEGVPKYVLFSSSNKDFRVCAVPVNPKSFICRKFLHKNWRGERSNKLKEISKIGDAEFVHETGFIGGATTLYGSLRMAIDSLNADFAD